MNIFIAEFFLWCGLKKGFTQHVDLVNFEKDYTEYVFDGLNSLSAYLKKGRS